MAFSYWRINATATAGGGATSYCTAAEIAMATSVGGSTACSGGTASASDQFSTNGPANAFDGNNATIWNGSSATGAKWIQYQFASAVDIVEIRWRTDANNDGRDRAPTAMTVEASNNGISWTPMGTWNTGAWLNTGMTKKFYPYAAGAGKRLWRLEVTANVDGTYAQCAELQLHTSIGGSDVAATSAVDAKTCSNGDYNNAFDGNAATAWTTDASGLPQWIQCQFPSDTTIVEVLWKAHTSDLSRNPSTLVVKSSVDGGANWVTEWTNSGIGTWTSGLQRTFSPSTLLVVANADAASSAENAVLTVHVLAANAATSASTAENVALAQHGVLAVANATAASSVPSLSLAADLVDYATIVDGRVAALGTDELPESDGDTLYFDLTDVDPAPEVGWYFEEICQTFSESPPVIPPGDVAPPYPPGSEPPIPGDPEYPEGPTDPGPLPPALVVSVLVPFHANHDATVSVALCPSVSTELSTKLRTAFDLRDACSVRVQADVETEVAGAKLTLMYSLDNGATWANVSAFGTGPFVSVASPGDQRGEYLNIVEEAQADVLLSLFVSGGDDATTLVLGNVGALVFVKTELGACEEIEELTECGVPAAIQSSDLSEFPTIDDFIAAFDQPLWQANTELGTPGAADFDPTTLFNGEETIKQPWQQSVEYGIGIFSSLRPSRGATGSDFTYFRVLKIEDGFDVIDTGVTGSDVVNNGFSVVEGYLNDADTAPGRKFFQYNITILNGHLYFVWYDANTSTYDAPIDLGLIADWTGRFLQLLMRVDQPTSMEARVKVYLDDACPDEAPTLLYQETNTVDRVWTNVDWGVQNNQANGAPASLLHTWEAQFAWDTDASVFGL